MTDLRVPCIFAVLVILFLTTPFLASTQSAGTITGRVTNAKTYGYQTLHTMNNRGKVTYDSENFPGPPLRVAMTSDITTVGGRVVTVLGETPTEGYVTLGLQGGVNLGRGVSLDVGVSNLTDTDYVNHLNAKNPYVGTPIPEPGRVFTTGLSVRF